MKIGSSYKEDHLNEIQLLRNFNSNDQIIKYFDSFKVDLINSAIIIEFCEVDFIFYTGFCCWYKIIFPKISQNGDLRQRISKVKNSNQKFSDENIFAWIIQATEGLKILHSNKIIHRDIKPAYFIINIWFNLNNNNKIYLNFD